MIGDVADPAFGYSGLTVVDIDADGDLDILTSNGDTMDAGYPTPDHGVRWWENTGVYPFEPHRIATMPGCYSAKPADLDGDGDLDIAAVSFLTTTVLKGNNQGTFDAAI